MKYKIEDDRIFIDLFDKFNKKYSGDFNDLFNNLRINNIPLTDKQKLLVIDYFNICSEEYLWYKKGRIPKNVWLAWKSGIQENLAIKEVGDLFKSEVLSSNSKISYYGLSEELGY
ncbi:MAG: hypothetical protein WCJ03_08655 [Bacteroidales bacterium]